MAFSTIKKIQDKNSSVRATDIPPSLKLDPQISNKFSIVIYLHNETFDKRNFEN